MLGTAAGWFGGMTMMVVMMFTMTMAVAVLANRMCSFFASASLS